MSNSRTEEKQFSNPEAPNYDWQKDREWFNQRLSAERLRNAALHNRIRALRAALRGMTSQKAKAALEMDVLTAQGMREDPETREESPSFSPNFDERNGIK